MQESNAKERRNKQQQTHLEQLGVQRFVFLHFGDNGWQFSSPAGWRRRQAASRLRYLSRRRTVVWNKQEERHKYWATRSSVRSHRSLARGKMNFWCLKMTWFCLIVRRQRQGTAFLRDSNRSSNCWRTQEERIEMEKNQNDADRNLNIAGRRVNKTRSHSAAKDKNSIETDRNSIETDRSRKEEDKSLKETDKVFLNRKELRESRKEGQSHRQQVLFWC